jgi:hypothetical protein
MADGGDYGDIAALSLSNIPVTSVSGHDADVP